MKESEFRRRALHKAINKALDLDFVAEHPPEAWYKGIQAFIQELRQLELDPKKSDLEAIQTELKELRTLVSFLQQKVGLEVSQVRNGQRFGI